MGNVKVFTSKSTPIEWLLDAEISYTGARCLLINGILAPGIFLSVRTIEKYLKTFICIRTQKIPMSHDLILLLDIVQTKGFLKNNQLRLDIHKFNILHDVVSYWDCPVEKRKRASYSYGRKDMYVLDKIVYDFERELWDNETIKGYTFPNTNIGIVRDALKKDISPNEIAKFYNEKWLFEDNYYFKCVQ